MLYDRNNAEDSHTLKLEIYLQQMTGLKQPTWLQQQQRQQRESGESHHLQGKGISPVVTSGIPISLLWLHL